MGKKTDYKRLYKKEKEARLKLSRALHDYKNMLETQAGIIDDYRDGKIKPEKIK